MQAVCLNRDCSMEFCSLFTEFSLAVLYTQESVLNYVSATEVKM